MHSMSSKEIADLIESAAHKVYREDDVIEVSNTIVAVGDLHGDFSVMRSIFSTPIKSFVFLGDYVARGEHSTEILIIVVVM
ncbi:unnamed protein product [Caenorhabditis brenneri]